MRLALFLLPKMPHSSRESAHFNNARALTRAMVEILGIFCHAIYMIERGRTGSAIRTAGFPTGRARHVGMSRGRWRDRAAASWGVGEVFGSGLRSAA